MTLITRSITTTEPHSEVYAPSLQCQVYTAGTASQGQSNPSHINTTANLPQEKTFAASSLQHRVHQTIALHTENSLDQIVTQDNRVKYTNEGRPGEVGTDHLDEVFCLMRELNETGISSETLGQCLSHQRDGSSFREALQQICEQIVLQFRDKPMIYVELGPEPTKTRIIINTLLQHGIHIDRYIAVDINPMSITHMRKALKGILPETKLEFVTAAFEDFRVAHHVQDDEVPALITMLGFQEGNEDPVVVNEWLREIARPGDLLLSESQLYSAEGIGNITNFYSHPAMQRFSRIAFEQANTIDDSTTLPTSLHRFFLLPIPFWDGQTAQVAILAEEFSSPTAKGRRNLHVSNFCLKLTKQQYRYYRVQGDFFEVIGEAFTGDETLHFQLSRRI